MAREDAGHYAMKHQSQELNYQIASVIEKEAVNSTITCAKVHAIAKKLGIAPKEVGIQVDLMELRIKQCGIGLFGYDPDGKNFDKNVIISDALEAEIRKIAPDSKTTCIKCWELASKLKLRRLEIGSACEKMGIKIKQCQLGAF